MAKYLFKTSLSLLLVLLFVTTPVFAADAPYPYAAGGVGTAVITGGDQVFIVIRLELWGDGVWSDPGLAARWEQDIETIWNGGGAGSIQKYKCYDVQIDAVVIVSDPSRTDPSGSAGMSGYHQIWVPDLKVGDLANAYSDYGLYLPTKASEVSFGYAYGDYDSATAQAYYEQHASEIKKQEGKGQVKGFVVRPGEAGTNQLASWGTIPNTATGEVVAHEIGHLMGLNHDSATCEDNLMSPSHPDNKDRTQVYPTYFKTMLDELDLLCQWTVRTDVTLTTPSGNYTPVGLQAHSEVVLKEESSAKNYIASGTAEVVYDEIIKEFHGDEFGWVPHNGSASYQAEIFYNYKDDLKTGGRMLLLPTLTTEPWEELTYIKSVHRLDPYDLNGAPTHHTNVKSALDGTDLVATPYTYTAPADTSCPAKPESDFTQQYYVDGIILDGITTNSTAKQFTNASLFAGQFSYNVIVTDEQPLTR